MADRKRKPPVNATITDPFVAKLQEKAGIVLDPWDLWDLRGSINYIRIVRRQPLPPNKELRKLW